MDKELAEKLFKYIKETDNKINEIDEIVAKLNDYINFMNYINDDLLHHILEDYFNICEDNVEYDEALEIVFQAIINDKQTTLDDINIKINKLNRDADWVIQPESAESINLLIKGVRDLKYKDIILYFEDLSNLCEDINITLMNNYLDGKVSVVSRTCGGKK